MLAHTLAGHGTPERTAAMSSEDPVDGDLLRRFLTQGDREALALLFGRHRTLAYRVALGVLGSPADAEDAVQDAFINLVAFAPRVRGEGPLGALVARMALRSAQHLCRSAARRRARETAWANENDPNPGTLPDPSGGDLAAAVREAVPRLQERYRIPIVLRYFEDLSTQEIADALGITQTAVTTRLSRGVGKLRAHLQGEAKALPVATLVALLAAGQAKAAPASLGARLAELSTTVAVPSPATPVLAGAGKLLLGTAKAKVAAVGLAAVVGACGIAAWQHARVPSSPAVTETTAQRAAGPGTDGARLTAEGPRAAGPVAVGTGGAAVPVRPGAAGQRAAEPPLQGRPAPQVGPTPAGARATPPGAWTSTPTERDPEEAEAALRAAEEMIARGGREVWPRMRFGECADALRRVVERWPETRSAQRAQDRLAWLMSSRLDDHEASVAEYQKLLERYPLNAFGEGLLHHIRWQCRAWLKDPAREGAVIGDYLRSLQLLAQRDPAPETQAGVLYMTGQAERYLGRPGSLDRLYELKARYPQSPWARRAEPYLVYRDVPFTAQLHLTEEAQHRSKEQEITPGCLVDSRQQRRLEVSAEAWDLDDQNFAYSVTVAAPLAAAETTPLSRVVEERGRSTATWRFPEDVPQGWRKAGGGSCQFTLIGTTEEKCGDLTVTRRSDDLGNGRRRITVYVKAPERVYVDVLPEKSVQVLGDTASPQPDTGNTSGALFFWGRAGRVTSNGGGLDCSAGKRFTFEVVPDPGVDTFYPSVEVGTWVRERRAPDQGARPEPRAVFGDTTVEFTSDRNCRIGWGARTVRERWVLESVLTRK